MLEAAPADAEGWADMRFQPGAPAHRRAGVVVFAVSVSIELLLGELGAGAREGGASLAMQVAAILLAVAVGLYGATKLVGALAGYEWSRARAQGRSRVDSVLDWLWTLIVGPFVAIALVGIVGLDLASDPAPSFNLVGVWFLVAATVVPVAWRRDRAAQR